MVLSTNGEHWRLPRVRPINFPISKIFRHIQNQKPPTKVLHFFARTFSKLLSKVKAAFFSLQWPMKAWLFPEETL